MKLLRFSALDYPNPPTSRRKTIAAVLVGIGAIVYGISPIDSIPELLTGPLGLVDDGAVWVGAALGVWKLLSERKQATASTES